MRRQQHSTEEYAAGIRAGNRTLLGKAITLVESTRPEHVAQAEQLLTQLAAQSPQSSTIRVAITGVPGVGKSTFIEALGLWLIAQGHRVAVLAIDPSSSISGGSILGDKTRMEQLSVSDKAFIRPSPAGDSLGGVARKTRETIQLVEAAGYDVVLVETVGVGQSEVAAHRMCDIFLLLLLPGAGDELQGIKRGIVEMADLLVVNKADGERRQLADMAQAHYRNATHLLPPADSGWSPKVLTASAQDNRGLDAVWEQVVAYQQIAQQNGYWQRNRQQQARYWLYEAIEAGIRQRFFERPSIAQALPLLEAEVLAGTLSPFAAARRLLEGEEG